MQLPRKSVNKPKQTNPDLLHVCNNSTGFLHNDLSLAHLISCVPG